MLCPEFAISGKESLRKLMLYTDWKGQYKPTSISSVCKAESHYVVRVGLNFLCSPSKLWTYNLLALVGVWAPATRSAILGFSGTFSVSEHKETNTKVTMVYCVQSLKQPRKFKYEMQETGRGRNLVQIDAHRLNCEEDSFFSPSSSKPLSS